MKYLSCELTHNGCCHRDGYWCKSANTSCEHAGEIELVPFGISCGISGVEAIHHSPCNKECFECYAMDILEATSENNIQIHDFLKDVNTTMEVPNE